MASSTSFRLLPVAALGLFLAQTALAAPSYRIEMIGKANGVTPKWAGSISENGNVAGGGTEVSTRDDVQFRARRGKKVEYLAESKGVHYPDLPQINNAGVVIGRYSVDFTDYGGMWAADGTLTDLAPLVGCADSEGVYPQGINDKGSLAIQVDCMINGVRTQAGFLVRDGVAVMLPTLNGEATYPRALNQRNQITGEASGPDGKTRAFIWEEGKPMKQIGRAGEDTYVGAMSDRGHLVGMTSANLQWHPFFYDGKAMHDVAKCGNREIWPVAINRDDLIAGHFHGVGVDEDAVLVRDGVCTELASMLDGSGAGWTDLRVDDMNNSGVIVGHGRFEGYWRVFLATPLAR